MRVTADGAGRYDCFPPEGDQVVMGDLARLPIACCRKLDLVHHSIEDVVVMLYNNAHVPGLGRSFSSFYAVGKQQRVVIAQSDSK